MSSEDDYADAVPDLPPLPGVADPDLKTIAGVPVPVHLHHPPPHHPHDHHHHHPLAGMEGYPLGLDGGGGLADDGTAHVEAALLAIAPGTGTGPSPSKDKAGGSARPACGYEGCNKQSQGPRNNFMCRKHFCEVQMAANPALDETTVKALAMAGKKKRANCSVEGCSKQSQGKAHNEMCRTHYLEAGGIWKGKKSKGGGGGGGGNSPKKTKTPKKAKKNKQQPSGSDPNDKSQYNYKYKCRVEGCAKLSQGARNGHMCRRHFSLSIKAAAEGVDGGGGSGAIAPDGLPTEQDLGTLAAVVVAQGPKKQQRPTCAVPGCPKQSQGRANGGMCRSHFRQMKKAGVPMDGGQAGLDATNLALTAAVAAAGASAPSAEAGASAGDAPEEGGEEEDPELAAMIAREIERIKKRDRGEDEDDAHGVEDYLGGDDDRGHNTEDDDGVAAAIAASTAAANPPSLGPSPKRARISAPPPTTESEPFMRRQQARNDIEALKGELQAAVSKEISLMAAMEGMPECVLCQNEPKAVTMMPCGHSAICSVCTFTENKCPICLEPIDEDRTVAV